MVIDYYAAGYRLICTALIKLLDKQQKTNEKLYYLKLVDENNFMPLCENIFKTRINSLAPHIKSNSMCAPNKRRKQKQFQFIAYYVEVFHFFSLVSFVWFNWICKFNVAQCNFCRFRKNMHKTLVPASSCNRLDC